MSDPKSFKYKEFCGTIHLHTKYSDGGVNFPTLINTASNVGLNFIVVTDHMSLGGLKDGYEGIKENVAVIVGYEHQDPQNLNHYLAMGVSEVFDQYTRPQDYVSVIKNAGGIGFIAHPAEKRNYIGKFPPYPWTDWQVKDFDGIELWNQMSEWVEKLRSWYSVFLLMYPRRFLSTAPLELVEKWDHLNKERFVSGIGGVDAHTRRIGKGLCSLIVFPLKVELKGIRTHVFLPEEIDFNNFPLIKKEILSALKNGHSFISNFRLGDATGTRIIVETKDGKLLPPGLHGLPNYNPQNISISIEDNAEIRLIKNGKIIQKKLGKTMDCKIDSNAVYRFEVYKKNKAWIYSNPMPVGTYPIL